MIELKLNCRSASFVNQLILNITPGDKLYFLYFTEKLRSGRLSNLSKVNSKPREFTKICLFTRNRAYYQSALPTVTINTIGSIIFTMRPPAKLFVNSIGTDDINCDRCRCSFGIYQLNKCILVSSPHAVIFPKRRCLLPFACL